MKFTNNNNWSKINIIIQHEYLSKIKTKGFIISTFLTPLVMVLIILIPGIITYFSMTSETELLNKIAIIDNSKTELSKSIIKSHPELYTYTTSSEKELKKDILDNKLDGFLVLPDSLLTVGIIKLVTNESIGLKTIENIESTINSAVKDERLHFYGITNETIDEINKSIKIDASKITKQGNVEQDNSEINSIIGYILGFIMYGLMLTYGNQVMQGVIEEKSNRIIEILSSSVKPFHIMLGKVIGIGAIGLTQIIIWLVVIGVAVLFASNLIMPSDIMQPDEMAALGNENITSDILSDINISIGLMISFVLYFLAGYFLYATLFAAIGSTVDSAQDANYLSTIVVLLIAVPILIIQHIVLEPESLLSTILSLIPLFSPILMPVRISIISIPLWQIIISYILLIITFILFLKLGSKIYRLEILRHGTKVTFKKLIQWIKA